MVLTGGERTRNWADEVEANYADEVEALYALPTRFYTPEQAANMISAAFLHYRIRKLAKQWQSVSAKKSKTKTTRSRHKRVSDELTLKHNDYHLVCFNPFDALRQRFNC